MNPTLQPTAPAAPVNLAELKEAMAKASGIAKLLVNDDYHGESQFAAGIRSTIEHANDLIALHEAWTAENPPKPAEAPAS